MLRDLPICVHMMVVEKYNSEEISDITLRSDHAEITDQIHVRETHCNVQQNWHTNACCMPYNKCRDAGPAVDVLAVVLLPLASLASLIPLSALCELTPLSIPPDSNELAESADVDSDVRVRVGTWYIPISAQLRMRIAQYVAQNARIMLCRFYA